jgi:hypothetical protein
MIDETQDPLYQGQADMRGRINVEGIEEAARLVADAWAAPFDLNAHARLQGIIRAAYEAGQLDGTTNKTVRVF